MAWLDDLLPIRKLIYNGAEVPFVRDLAFDATTVSLTVDTVKRIATIGVISSALTLAGDVTGPGNNTVVSRLTGSAGVVNFPIGNKFTSTGGSNVGDIITTSAGVLSFGNLAGGATTVNIRSGGATVVQSSGYVNLIGAAGGGNGLFFDGNITRFRDSVGNEFARFDHTAPAFELDSLSGTFSTVGLHRFKSYGSLTTLIGGRNAGGDANILKQNGSSLTFADDNNTSGWSAIYLGFTVTVQARTTITNYAQTSAGWVLGEYASGNINARVDLGASGGAFNFRVDKTVTPTFKQDAQTTDVAPTSWIFAASDAYSSASTNVDGAWFKFTGGAAKTNGTTGKRGGSQFHLGGSTSYAMLDIYEVAVNRAVVGLFQLGGGTTATDVPSGSGVLYIHSAAAVVTSQPANGIVLWYDGGRAFHGAVPGNYFLEEAILSQQNGSANSQANKIYKQFANLRTTNATATTIATIATSSGTVNSIKIVVNGRDVTSGTVGDGVTFEWIVQFKNVSGTLSAAATQSTQLKCNDTSMATCALTVTTSGTNILVQVAGLAGVTIDWGAATMQYVN
jgi:hypothetical protein